MFMYRTDELSTGQPVASNLSFFFLLFIVNCLPWIESSLSFPLFLFSWHSWVLGENPEFLMKCKALHMQGDIFGSLIATVWPCSRCMNLHQIQCKKSKKQQWHIAAKLKMYVTSSILSLTGLLCFKCVSKPCTQMNDPAKEFLLLLNEMAYTGQI